MQFQTTGLALGYIVAWIILCYVSGGPPLTGIGLWCLPAGLTFAILLEYGWRALPLPILAALIASLPLWSWEQWPYYLVINLAAPLGYAGVAHALRCYPVGRRRGQSHFNDARRMVLFLAAAAAGSLFAALVSVAMLKIAGLLPPRIPPRQAMLSWWLGDFVGIATLAPLLLILVAPLIRRLGRGKPPRWPPSWLSVNSLSTWIMLVQSLVLILLLVVLFWMPPYLGQDRLNPFMILLLLPVLVWFVAKHNMRGALITVFLFELGIVTMVSLFEQADLAFHYQIVMTSVALSGLLTGALFHERLANTALFRDLAEISNDLLWECDADGNLCDLRGHFVKTMQPGTVPLGRNWWDVVIPQEQDTDLAVLKAAIRQRRSFQQLVLRLRLPGQTYSAWTRNSGLPLFDEDGEFMGYRGTTTDISDHKKAEELLRDYDRALEAKIEAKVEERTRILAEASMRNWRLANYDSLTSLPNRNLLFEHLRKDLQQARRQWRLLAVLLVDLDGFKEVNDTHGHDVGDELLQQVAARLQQCVRSTDTAARLGGDEFTVVLSGLEHLEAVAVAQKIIARLAEPVSLSAATVIITASIGIALYRPELPANLETMMSLLRQADSAMYAAKRAGKNSWRLADQVDLD